MSLNLLRLNLHSSPHPLPPPTSTKHISDPSTLNFLFKLNASHFPSNSYLLIPLALRRGLASMTATIPSSTLLAI